MHRVENGGSGRPIVFIHGNSLSGEIWREQMHAPELARMRLMAIDLPGHGRSEHYPLERTYSPDSFAEDVLNDIEGMERPIIVGHSLGGHIAVRVARLSPNVSGTFIIGTPPLASAADLALGFVPSPLLSKIFSSDVSESDALEMAEAFTWPGSRYASSIARMIHDTDPRVRGDIGSMVATGSVADEVTMIREAKGPTCVAHAADETFISLDYLQRLPLEQIWMQRIHLLKNAGHCAQLQKPAAFNSLLLDFVSTIA